MFAYFLFKVSIPDLFTMPANGILEVYNWAYSTDFPKCQSLELQYSRSAYMPHSPCHFLYREGL